MLGNYVTRRFGLNWLVISITVLVAIAGFSGHNSVTGSWDWSRGVDNVAAIFGGVTSLAAIVVLVFGLAVAFFTVVWVANDENLSNIYVGLLTLAYIVIAAYVKTNWIEMPSGALWILVAFIVLVTIATALVTPLASHRPTTTRVRS